MTGMGLESSVHQVQRKDGSGPDFDFRELNTWVTKRGQVLYWECGPSTPRSWSSSTRAEADRVFEFKAEQDKNSDEVQHVDSMQCGELVDRDLGFTGRRRQRKLGAADLLVDTLRDLR
jgi:hypothetical protein